MDLRSTAGPPSDDPVLTVRGEHVALGPLRKTDAAHWVRWLNDLDVLRGLDILGRHTPITLEAELAWFDQMQRQSATDCVFTIYEVPTLAPIGNCGLHGIDYRHGTATFGIMIGEKDRWNRGYGTEATRLTLDFAFNALGLHNVQLTVYGHNRRAIRTYEKAGFRLVGHRREARRLSDRRVDVLIMDALASDLPNSVVRGPLSAD